MMRKTHQEPLKTILPYAMFYGTVSVNVFISFNMEKRGWEGAQVG